MTDEEFIEIKIKSDRAANQIIYAYGAYDSNSLNKRLRGLNDGDVQYHPEDREV